MRTRNACFGLMIALVGLQLMSCGGTGGDKVTEPVSVYAGPAAGAAGGITIAGTQYWDTGHVIVDGKPVKGLEVTVSNLFCHWKGDQYPCWYDGIPKETSDHWAITDGNGYYKANQGTQNGCYVYSTVRKVKYGGKLHSASETYGKFPENKGDKHLDISFASCTPSCGSAKCGYAPNGCGGTIYCGGCAPGYACMSNQCEILHK